MDAVVTLRVMYFVAIVGAGGVGAAVLFAPKTAARYVFSDAIKIDAYIKILGALWLAIGVLAVAGMFAPLAFIPVLLIQLVYKSAWLGFAAFPAIASGHREPGLLVLAGLFSLWVMALLALVPFQLTWSAIV